MDQVEDPGFSTCVVGMAVRLSKCYPIALVTWWEGGRGRGRGGGMIHSRGIKGAIATIFHSEPTHVI